MRTERFFEHPRPKSRRRPFRPHFEALEDRCLLTLFLVNSTADPGAGVCDAAECTLREAILAANANAGPDDIQFNIGMGAVSIMPLNPLPQISDPVNIDATTQPGFMGSPIVEIDGTAVPGAAGLTLNTTNTTVRGLVINRFGGPGIMIQGGAGHRIAGNFIGLSLDPNTAAGNGGPGIIMLDSNGTTIGGTATADRNLIAGNTLDGISIGAGKQNVIQGNFIGTNINGAAGLGNNGAGIFVQNSAQDQIGGIVAGEGNTIAFNGGDGVTVSSGNQIRIIGNSIFTNGGLGIDLGVDGPNFPQDPDPGAGANDSQNFPVLTSATATGTATNFLGTLTSAPGVDFTVAFYASATADPSGFGEGQTFLGRITVTTDPAGTAQIDASVNMVAPPGSFITATATVVANGDTSEFSQAIPLTVPTFRFDMNTYTVGESAGPATITVQRTGGNAGQFSVDFATSNGSATAGFDYQSVSKTLTFPSGVTSMPVDVTILLDMLDEADETVNLQLSMPSNGSALGNPNTAVLTILDDDPTPSLSIDSVNVMEGDAGTVDAVFTVSLSAVSGQDVTVNFATADGSAKAPGDFTALPLTLLTIPAGMPSGTITVKVNGDTLDETDETFSVNLSNPTNATIAAGQGTGTGVILDDDPTPTLSINSIMVNEGSAGTVDAVFTVTLSAVSGQDVTVNFTTADGSAKAPGDYTAVPLTLLTIPAGAPSGTITVKVKGDTLDETDETLFVNLSNPTNATIAAGQGTGTATILDDDATPTLSINSIMVNEGDAGTVDAIFTVTLSAVSGQDVTVNFATADGSAKAPGDYTALPLTLLTIPAGAASGTITVKVNGDTLDEADETLSVNLSNPTNATIAVGQGTGTATILDDDPTPTLSINNIMVTEGDAGTVDAVFTVTLSAVSGQDVTVNFATADGSGKAPGDYTAIPLTLLTIPAGAPSGTITVKVNGDTLDETDETLFVNLSNPTNATIAAGQGTGTGTILDNDPTPTVSINNIMVTEADAGTVDAIFTVTLSAVSGQDVTVNFATADGSAKAPGDYAALPLTLLTIPAGAASGTITVKVNGDTLDEVDETFSVNLSNPTNATIAVGQGTGTATVLDNDATPTLSINSIMVTEGDAGTVDAIFTVTLSAISGQDVSVNFTTADGSAKAPGDYTALPLTLLTIPAGAPSGTITVKVSGDTLDEADETFSVNLSNPTNATIAVGQGTGSATILDNDATPTISINSIPVNEGDVGSVDAIFTVTLSAVSGQDVTVNFATADGSAKAPGDYTALPLSLLTIPAGAPSGTITVKVNGDTLDEADETFSVNLSNPTNATIASGQSSGTATILDNDPTPTLSINSIMVNEADAGTVDATFTVTLSAVSGQDVTVNFATVDGSAKAPGDYTARPLTLLTIPAGAPSGTITVKVNGDTLNELTESFSVNLSNPTNATIAVGQGTGTATILDNDPIPSLSIGNTTVNESDSGTTDAVFTVTLSAASGQDVTVNFATANGSAVAPGDYTAIPLGLLTIPAGAPSGTITVSVKGDMLNEANENFFVNLSNPTNASIAVAQGTATIFDNSDPAPSLSIGNASVTESDAGTVDAVFTVTLSALSGQDVNVSFATANGSAVAPGDYVATVLGLLTIPAGAPSGTITVQVNGDLLDEGNETFVVNLFNPVNATIAVGQGTGTIVDNDPTPTLSIDSIAVNEGDAGTVNAIFTVSLSATSGQDVTVNFATANGSAIAPGDYTAIPTALLTIPAGSPSGTITIEVNGDLLDESNETFFVNLSNAVNASIAVGQGTGTIVDNDATPSLVIDDVMVNEGDAGTSNATFTVTLSAISGQDVTVNFATTDKSAMAPGDYTAIPPTALTIPAGTQSGMIVISIVGDTIDEFDETFTVDLTSPKNATIADAQGIGTIVDNDPAPTISIDDPSVIEGDAGFTTMTFTVSLSSVSAKDVTVMAATADNTALAPADYTAIPVAAAVLVTIPAGNLTGTVTVQVVGDMNPEPTETFFVNLFGAVNATIADAQGRGTILDNDGLLDLAVLKFGSAAVGAPLQLEIQYTVFGAAAPSIEFAFFASADARFDNTDTEQPPRLILTDPSQLSIGPHTAQFNGAPYRAILDSLDNRFVVTHGQALDAAGNVVPEADLTNNDISFIGLFHEAGTPLIIRGKDDTDLYADNPNDVISITGGVNLTVTADFLANPVMIAAATITEIRVLGLGGADSIVASADMPVPMTVRGGPGNDTATGGRAADLLLGEEGDDLLGGRLGNDVLDGGPGTDTADFGVEAHGVVANLTTGTARGQGRDRLRALENLIGSAAKDRLTGDAGNNVLLGAGGADFIAGGAGNDVLGGGDGDDTCCGGDGRDMLMGGEGNDRLEGGNDDDELQGGNGADFLCGGAGNDVVAGNAGNDSMMGESGIDRLLGGADFDAILFDASDLPVDLGGTGRDGGKAFRFGE